MVHSCCAPCASYVMEYLSPYFELSMYFYNPNIDTKWEYDKRASELERLIGLMDLPRDVEFIQEEYDPESFENMSKGHENDPERGYRCRLCYRLRMEKTAQYIQNINLHCPEKRYDFFATTLTVSPYKDAQAINIISDDLAQKYGLNYLESDFKKKNGYKRSIELGKKYHLYRQNYCGCRFSRQTGEKGNE